MGAPPGAPGAIVLDMASVGMVETGDMQIILNGDNAAVGFGTGLGASQVSPRAERAARRERERERRLRELCHDIALRPPGGFVADPMYVPVTIARLLQEKQELYYIVYLTST